MSGVTLPFEAPLPRMQGRAEIGVVHADGRDRLAHLYQRAPLRVLFPDPPAGDPPHAALVTTSGGLAGGDRLEVAVKAGPQAALLVVGSAAEKVYRSTWADTVMEVALNAAAGARLEYLPQETILFEGARLRRTTRIDVAAESKVLAGEILIFGRAARAEKLTCGLVREAWEIRRDGRLIWADALHLENDLAALLAAPAGFNGATAAAAVVCLGTDPAALRDQARALNADYAGRFAAGVIKDILVARWLDNDAMRLRGAFATTWKTLRHATLDLPARLPRLWDI